MAVRIQLRRDSASNWSLNNPSLRPGEVGIESDTLKFKIGPANPANGVATPWNSIAAYANVVPSDLNSTLNGYLEVGDLSNTVAEIVNGAVYVPGTDIIFEGTANSHELTLTAPDVTSDKTITLPDATTTLVGTDVAQTLTNKTLTSPVVSGLALSDASIVFEGAVADSYETTLTVGEPTADRTITLPDVTGTVVTTGDTGSVTNAMLAGSIANNKLANSSVTINGYEIALGAAATYGTDNINEGTTNLYFTNERAQDAVATALSNGTHTNITVSYDDNANAISLTGAVTYTDEKAQDAVAQALANGTHTNITVAYDDANNAISLTGAQTYNDEMARDAIGAALTGGTGITVTPNDNADTITVAVDSTIATKTYADSAVTTGISNLIASAPGALDTLNELALALGNDANFSTTVTNALATKQDKVTGVSDTEIGYLDGVTSGIQAQIDSKAASGHSHTASNVTDFNEAAQDAVAAAFAAGTHTNITVSYDDNTNSISLTGAQTYNDENARDAVASLITNSNHDGVSVAYTDSGAAEGNLVFTNTDKGSAQNIFKNISVDGTTLVADSNNDTLTVAAGTGIGVSGNATSDTFTISNTGVTSVSGTSNEIEVSGSTGSVTIGLPDNVTIAGNLTLSTAPTQANHAATKAYVDNTTAGLNFHAPAHAATTANLSATYSNGTSGVGATLTASANGALVIDGHTLNVADRVLVKDQTTGFQNGLYVVTATGDGSNPWILTRATDADNSPAGEVAYGDFVFVQNGSTNAGFGFIVNTTGTITIGTTAISYVQFNAGQTVVAGNGLTESSPGTLAINTAVTADVSTAQTFINKTISGASNTLSNIGNSSLTNSKVTIGSTDVNLGATATTLAGLASVTSTSFVGALTGNADTVTNGVYTSSTYSNPLWISSLAWTKISSTPTTIAGYGITDPIVLTSGSYANPAWITSLGWNKISSTPTTLSGYGITDAQPLDADLTAIAGLSGTSGFLKKTAADTWTLDTNTYLTTSSASSTYLPLTGGTISSDLTVTGNLTVNGSTTTISSTTLSVTDKNIEIAKVASPTNITADGAGITIKGTTDKTFNWVASTASWTSSEDIDLASGKVLRVAGTQVLSATQYTGNAATVTNGVYTNGTYSNPSWLTALAWSKISSTPTTLSGYGITDGLTSTTAASTYLTQSNAASTYAPLASPTFTGTVSGITKSMVGLGNVENTALSTWAGSTNITTLGTIATGTWSGTTIATTKGGTGLTSYATGDILYASASNTLAKLAAGTNGQILTLAAGVPTWAAAPAGYSAPTIGSTSIASGATVTQINGLVLGATSTTTINTNTATTVDTNALSAFTTAKYVVSIKQGSKIRSSQLIAQTDGTSVDYAEFAVVETGGSMNGILVEAVASGSNCLLRVTITNGAAVNATVKIQEVLI